MFNGVKPARPCREAPCYPGLFKIRAADRSLPHVANGRKPPSRGSGVRMIAPGKPAGAAMDHPSPLHASSRGNGEKNAKDAGSNCSPGSGLPVIATASAAPLSM